MSREIGIQAGMATVVAALIGAISSVPVWIAAVVLLIAWPTTSLLVDSLWPSESIAPASLFHRALPFVLFVVIAGVLKWVLVLPIGQAIAFSVLGCSIFGALNGILMEWEDHAPGGFLDPKSEDSPK